MNDATEVIEAEEAAASAEEGIGAASSKTTRNCLKC